MPGRKIVLDTETTGLFPERGDRIIEIACLEMIDGVNGRSFRAYINPDRDSSPGALRIHGLTTEFLADKPRFFEIVDDFLQFIGDDELIIHNAPFDIGFINSELNLINRPGLSNSVVDTVVLAKSLYPREYIAAQLMNNGFISEEKAQDSKFRAHSLDNLCLYYDINLTSREAHHGALIDCELLAQVYLCLQDELNFVFRQSVSSDAVRHTGIFSASQGEPVDNDNISLSYNPPTP